MDMGHLYHDAAFGGPIVELDVKELMRTREVNACEERNFLRKSQSYDRAMGLAERATNFEKWRVGQSLNMIMERSPHLERSLAREKARLEAVHRAVSRRRAAAAAGGPSGQSQAASAVSSLAAAAAARDGTWIRRPSTRKGRSALKSIGRRRRQDREKKSRHKKEDGPILNTDLSLDRNLGKSTVYIKRNEHAVKTLARINLQLENRRREHRHFQEKLVHYSQPLMDRARIVLRGRPDIDVEQFLYEFEDYLNPKEKPAEEPVKVLHNPGAPIHTQRRIEKRNGGREKLRASDKNLPRQGEKLTEDSQDSGESKSSSLPPLNSRSDLSLSSGGLSEERVSSHGTHDDVNVSPPARYEDVAARLRHLSMSSHNLTVKDTNNGDGRLSPERGLSPGLSRSRPASGSIHLPAIVATKSDVLNLRSRPGSSSNNLHGVELPEVDFDLQPRLISLGEEQSLISTSMEQHPSTRTKLEDGHPTRLVDINNNERSRSSHGEHSMNEFGEDIGSKHLNDSNNASGPGDKQHIETMINTEKDMVTITRENHIESIPIPQRNKPPPALDSSHSRDLNSSPDKRFDNSEHETKSRVSPSKSIGMSATPSTILSQVILEDDEEDSHVSTFSPANLSPQPSSPYISHNKNSDHNKIHHTRGSNYNNHGESRKTQNHHSLTDSSNPGMKSKTLNNENVGRRQQYINGEKTTNTHIISVPDDNDKMQTSKDRSQTNPNRAHNSLPGRFAINYTGEAAEPPQLRQRRHGEDETARKNLANAYNGGDGACAVDANKAETSESNGGLYTLACTVGLPKLWRQTVDEKKKDKKQQPEVSAAAVARKHRRTRQNSGVFYGH